MGLECRRDEMFFKRDFVHDGPASWEEADDILGREYLLDCVVDDG